jgi:hypothetical protein
MNVHDEQIYEAQEVPDRDDWYHARVMDALEVWEDKYKTTSVGRTFLFQDLPNGGLVAVERVG